MAKGKSIGRWAFLIGLIIAVVLGLGFFGEVTEGMNVALVIIGLIVGLLNIADKETEAFLISGAVLIIASNFGGDALATVNYVGPIFSALLVLFVPATIVVAIKNVFQLAKA